MSDKAENVDEVNTQEENRQQLTPPEFRSEVLSLIEQAYQSGLSDDQIQEELDDLSVGVPYYREQISRILQAQQQQEQQQQEQQ